MCDDTQCDCADDLLTSSDVRTAIVSGETFLNRPIQYAAVGGLAVFEGCIILGEVDEVEALTADARQAFKSGDDPEITPRGVIISGPEFRWPNATMPYEIDPALPDINRQRVASAIAHWNAQTRMRFVLRTASNASRHPNYVRFTPADGCWSYIGMRRRGRQDIGLSTRCGSGSTIHEIGHAFGLWHEQSREDRNGHIRILWQNINAGKEHNFNQHISDGDDVGAYDYGSIMHYGSRYFSKNGDPTIEVLAPGKTIGQRRALSQGDINAVHRMYGL